MNWQLIEHPSVEEFRKSLKCADHARIEAAYEVLQREGPRLGRPLVDRISGSLLHHLKELRVSGSEGAHYRILFAFDPNRQAVLLVSGNKKGQWRQWYQREIQLAEQRYQEHLRNRGLFMT